MRMLFETMRLFAETRAQTIIWINGLIFAREIFEYQFSNQLFI